MCENQPLVSIIMPVYNCEKYLQESIESVLSQSYQNWELLIVDDGSTDRSPGIIDAYAQKDARIKSVHKKNEGVSMARNLALDQVCGEYVTFIDSDDVYHVDRLNRMLQVFEQNRECDIVFSRHTEFTGEWKRSEANCSREVKVFDDEILIQFISDSKNHFMCNAMIRSNIARKERFAPIRFAEDYCFIRDCALHCRQMAVLDEVLYFYRRDNENAMTSHFFSEKYVPDYMELVKNAYQFCVRHNLHDSFFQYMVAHEYAQNSMRIRKCTSYTRFVSCMNDAQFRAGLGFADASRCTRIEKLLLFLVKHKLYVPFVFFGKGSVKKAKATQAHNMDRVC